MKPPKHEECASDYRLWQEWIDPVGNWFSSEDAFEAESFTYKLALIEQNFGPNAPEEPEEDDDSLDP
jgi:hypothetical protein